MENANDADDAPEPVEYALWGTSAANPESDEEDPCGVDELVHCGFNDDGFSSMPASAFADMTVDDDDFGEFNAATDEDATPWAPFGVEPAKAPLEAAEISLIKSTMASLDITPPPWVRKMQHVERIKQMIAAGATDCSADGGAASSQLNAQWAAHVQQASGPGGALISQEAMINASPLLAMPAASGSISGVSAPRRVSAKQLAAERRALREKAKSERAMTADSKE